MECRAAQALFEDYAQAAMEHFEAADKLSNLVGQHGPFAEQKADVERAHEKCSAAQLALEQHWAQHSCRCAIWKSVSFWAVSSHRLIYSSGAKC
jgi:hypothetical protein